MSARTRALVFLLSTPLLAFVIVGGLLGASRAPAVQTGVPHLKVFQDVVGFIVNAYVEEVNVDKVFDGAMRGLTDGLDPASGYLTPAEVRTLDANQPLPVEDVGITLTRQFYLRIVGVRDGSPAARANLQTGDFIRSINDMPTRDMSVFAGARMLHGAAGTKVTLLVIRGNAADPHTIELTRETPGTTLATSKRLTGGEAYVRVVSFGPGTADAIKSNIASLGAAATSGVIIDLRTVGDGAPEDGIGAARLFIKSGTLATRAGRDASDKVVTTAGAGDGALAMPVVLLVSNGTANGAEVFASAMVDAKRAKLVGEPTAGIAAVQKLTRLPDGHGLWMTYERYVNAAGTPLQEHGLRPDVAVDMARFGFDEQPPTTDDALDRAATELKKGLTAPPESVAAPDAAAPGGTPPPRPGALGNRPN